MSRHDYLYTHANPVNFIDPSGFSTTMSELNSVMAGIGALAAIPWVSWGVPAIKLATAASLAVFLASYGIYLAVSTSGDDGTDRESEEDEEDQYPETRINSQPSRPQPPAIHHLNTPHKHPFGQDLFLSSRSQRPRRQPFNIYSIKSSEWHGIRNASFDTRRHDIPRRID